ncbi:transmembrane protein 70 homolog, mitochondrial [Cimex lectularius]|uniref:Transmembrane protein 70 homolog, mitochondrial n=1 Tax=Cimex lectularius TaxID=79782 RepID=A0A8I6RQ37_CIMLE|nr:transmembrane protein 70 homolog, mitochondrial [Cimex lectularius]
MFKIVRWTFYPVKHLCYGKTNILENFKKIPTPLPLIKYCHSLSEEDNVYNGPLKRQIHSVKLFSLATSVGGLLVQPVIFQRAAELEASTASIVGVCSFVGFFTFVTPLLLHLVTRKYVLNITYSSKEDSYTATVYTLFLRRKNVTFKPDEVVVPDVPGMFTSLTVRGIPLFMDARFFTDVNHYKKIMGYDKPMDFKFGSKD